MPDSFFDQLEEWLEAQVPTNLHELPYRMLETVERVSQEIFDTLNIHGPPSISIPFPPFKEVPPPPPPVPQNALVRVYDRADRLVRAHPYVVAGALMSVGLAGTTVYMSRKPTRGGIIVLLAPSPMPPLLQPLIVTLLRDYTVLVAVPHVEDAEQLEQIDPKLRVLIYDPDEPSTFPPFHRSLLATLKLFDKPVHSFISLYPLHPSPPSQPSPLPALPTLIQGAQLITLYPSSSSLVQPDSFANQILTTNHQLLARNLGAFSSTRSISVYVGEVDLPKLPTVRQPLSRREEARLQLANATTQQKAFIIKDYIFGYFYNLFTRISAYTGLGTAGKEYSLFEQSFLRILRGRRRRYHLGQYSYLSLFLSRLPPFILPRLLPILPALPSANGPRGSPQAQMPMQKEAVSDQEDLASSFHTSASSRGHESESAGSGLGDSWVGLDK